jgi:hypothetical protein
MPRIAAIGGLIASLILIALGVGSLVIGLNGEDTVKTSIKDEKITGTPDMAPDKIQLTQGEDKPDCDVAGEAIDTGDKARCFAQYMRIHALEETGGKTYAELPRFVDKNGTPTEDEAAAVIDPQTQQPAENPIRQVWVTETALSTALNTSYFATQVARFGVAVGIALILIGIGFAILSWFGGFRGRRDTV